MLRSQRVIVQVRTKESWFCLSLNEVGLLMMSNLIVPLIRVVPYMTFRF